MSTSATISTRFGKVELKVTDGEHVHVGTPRGEGLDIRGVDYSVSAHFYRWADGQMHLGQEKSLEWERKRECFMRRLNPANWRDADKVSDSAKNAAIEALTTAVNAWAAKNAKSFSFAQFQHIEDEISRAQNERQKHLDAIKELDKEIATLKAQLKR